MSDEMIGTIPVYADASGEAYIDPADGVEATDETGALWPFGKKARLRRLDRKINRLQRRSGRVAQRLARHEEPPMQPVDTFSAAAANGMLIENQYNGLGHIVINAATTGVLADSINRTLWAKSLVLTADAPALLLVNGISIASVPINIGAKGAPVSMFAHDSTRFGVSFGRRFISVGQTFQVSLENTDAANPHNVSGGVIVDEVNPFVMQNVMEQMVLTAAAGGQ